MHKTKWEWQGKIVMVSVRMYEVKLHNKEKERELNPFLNKVTDNFTQNLNFLEVCLISYRHGKLHKNERGEKA